ncbi:MAG TPA: ABC transporter permease [Marmoricola sp.]|nr:ABC transporter permease [Marmoricola sp.]
MSTAGTSTDTLDRPPGPEPEVRDPAERRRRTKAIVVLALVLALLIYFALDAKSPTVKYILGERVSQEHPTHDLAAAPVAWTCVVLVAIALGLAVAHQLRRQVVAVPAFIVAGLAFYVGFMIWEFRDQAGQFQAAISNPLPGTVAIATPLILGALAGVMCERAGVINIAIEGQFLAGAFLASVAASFIFDAFSGLVAAIVGGMLIGALLALFSIRYQVNQVVVGVVLVAFAAGITAFLTNQIPEGGKWKEYLNQPPILDKIAIPGLSKIPLVGDAFFTQTVLVYLMYAAIVLVPVVLYQTRWGLRVRSVGEHPKAADTVGIKVNRVRWQAVLIGSGLAGLGGAYFTVGSSGSFTADISSGQGFIALAAVIMGRWHPVGATLAATFFGFMWNLQNQVGLVGKVPPEFLGAAPYIATIIAVAGFVGRVRPPAADGEPYVKG